MEQLVKLSPNHLTLKDGTPLIRLPDYVEKLEYRHGLEIPHFLNILNNGTFTAIIPSETVLQLGDIIHDEYNWSCMVSEVLERRKARGFWKNSPYDSRPDWVRIKYI